MSETLLPNLTPRELLESLLGHLGFVFEIEEKISGETQILNIKTRDPRRLIGRDGHTLDDLQLLLHRLISEDEDQQPRILVDVEGYREREQQSFLDRVRQVALRVERSGEEEVLAPMNSYDRYLIHQAYKDHPKIKTRSLDPHGRMKRVLIELRKKE